ncbi:hypothetical protein [Cupriavidus plantarum]|uniref:hypothetical protein n=1 Tax=Cupriavidus plantarum TaxID=942865 RepID=UPI00339D3DDB
MTKIIKTTENNIEVEYHIAEDTPRLNGDGFGPALVGFPLSTFSLFQQQLTADPAKTQERKVVATVQVPTTAILELAQNIVSSMQQNSALVEQSLKNIKDIISKQPR